MASPNIKDEPAMIRNPELFFKHLETLFNTLSTLYTFCTVQRGVVCTYQNLKPSIEKQSGILFTLESLGMIKYLLSDFMSLYWSQSNDSENCFSASDLTDSQSSLVIEFADTKVLMEDVDKKKQKKRKFNKTSLKNQVNLSMHSSKIPTFIQARRSLFNEALSKYQCSEAPIGNTHQSYLESIAMSQIPPHNVLQSETMVAVPTITTISTETFHSDEFLIALKSLPTYRDQISEKNVFVQVSKDCEFGELDNPLPECITLGLHSDYNISRLYSHQAISLNHIQSNKHALITTSTSSGKSLIYQLAIITHILKHNSTALLMFPTKALAQDQKRSFDRLMFSCNLSIKMAIYDGDTASQDRRNSTLASILFTNPDMLHCSFLPFHEKWKHFIQNLKYIIIDEMHYWKGSLGSHVSMLFKRLHRVLNHYNNSAVVYIACSATLSNPLQVFRHLTGQECEVVDIDGSPSGKRTQVLWNPPYKNKYDISLGRRYYVDEACLLIRFLIQSKVRTICFTTVHYSFTVCEAVIKNLTDYFEGHNTLKEKFLSYRGGYTAQERRNIEASLLSGECLCVVATNALELGIDIGGLDVVVHVGLPVNKASYIQQYGRVGRNYQESMSIVVLDGNNKLCQYYARNPNEIFIAKMPNIIIDEIPENVYFDHLRCMAAEIPITVSEVQSLKQTIMDVDIFQKYLESEFKLSKLIDAYHPKRGSDHPCRRFQIRNIIGENYQVIDSRSNQVIEIIEENRVSFTLYDGAVMMHQGDTYLITALFPEAKTARAQKDRLNFFTAPVRCTNLFPIETLITFDCLTYKMCYGTIRYEEQFLGYTKLDIKTRIPLQSIHSTLPHLRSKRYKGSWVEIPLSFISKLSSLKGDLSDCIACICSMFSLLLSTILEFSEESQTRISFQVCPPRIFFFGAQAQFGKKAMELFPELIKMAKESIKACQCDKGCIDCIHSTYGSITKKAHVLCLLDSFNANLICTEDFAALNYN